MINKPNLEEENKSGNNSNENNNNKDVKIKLIEQKENKNIYNKNNKNDLINKEIKNDLTELNSNNYQKYIKNRQNNQNNQNKNNKIILKNLKQKETNLINEINSLKKLKNEMGYISYNNISQTKIDNILHNNKIKNIKNLENNLVDKLSEIKRQINDISKNDSFITNKNQKPLSQKINTSNYNIYKASINKIQLLEQNEIRLMEIEKEYKNKQKELKDLEDKTKNEKLKYLLEQRQKEMIIIQKRKKEIDEKMKNIKSKMQSPPKKKETLFYKMEQNFQENEKKLLHKIITERKVKNIYYKQNVDIENINNEFQNYKNQLQQRAIEQTNNIKKVWHSRSMIMKKYETNMMKTLKETEEAKEKDEKIIEFTKKGRFLDKELYGKKRVHLPPIDEKLKEESIKNQIDIKNLKGKDRINYVNERYMQKGFKIRNINKEMDYGKKYVFNKIGKRKNQPQGKLNPIQINKMTKSFSSENVMNKNNNLKNLIKDHNSLNNINNNINVNNNNNINNIKKNNINNIKVAVSADKIRIRRNPKEINYLNQNRNKDENKQKYHKWNKYIINKNRNDSNEIDLEGIQNINKEIETIDEKVNMGNELIKIKGGYQKNVELGDKLNNMLIDSINGKLAVFNELFSNENNNKIDKKV